MVTATKPERRNPAGGEAPPEILDVTVLAGGPGAERAVSLDSGAAVAASLRRLGHRVSLRDISPEDLSALDRPGDFVFIALHGEFGEDGALQSLLEARGIRFCGSGAQASQIAMNKVVSKRRFEQQGLPTPAYHVVDRNGLLDLSGGLKLPVIVKPVSSGSSVDTTIARSPEALSQAATTVVERYGQALVEQYIAGRELTVGVLDDTALPVCEIRTRREFYDYDAKYVDDDTEYLFDLDLPPALLRDVQDISIQAHQALGCAIFSRVDLMLEPSTNQPYLLEVNTIPGFTSHSLVPKAAARAGISFDDLCRRIIQSSWVAAR